jgi:penicillin-binding protein 2
MIPRRNPEIAIVVLQEHGDWGSGSAMIAQKIAIAYVNKKRLQDKNVLDQAGATKPIEVGAVWSEPQPQTGRGPRAGATAQVQDRVQGGHFFVTSPPIAAAPQAVAAGSFSLPSWLGASLLRFKEELH